MCVSVWPPKGSAGGGVLVEDTGFATFDCGNGGSFTFEEVNRERTGTGANEEGGLEKRKETSASGPFPQNPRIFASIRG